MDSSEIDRTGVSICQETISRMNIIFREQTVKDYGIDAIIEPKTESYASGQLIGLQIKKGEPDEEKSVRIHVFRKGYNRPEINMKLKEENGKSSG